jgi:serine/threonine protein kinase
MAENSMNYDETTEFGSGFDSYAALGSIDQYELKRELGGGGFGTVYLARDSVSGVDVAVKGLPPFVKNNREEMDNIRANFNLVHAIHHPHIAAALYLHPATNVAYSSEDVRQKLRVLAGDMLLVMAYAPGITLSRWRKQFPENKVPPAKAVEIARQIADALDYAHALKVIHRDIKPANVMIETDISGRVTARVLDFGLAAEIRSSMGRVSKEVHDTSGTRPYMAPEQWLGGRQGPATDQYALAVLLHELVKTPSGMVSCDDYTIYVKRRIES